MDALRSGGFKFVASACADSRILEEISGISKLMENVDVDLCESDDDF